jgi:hypothetical protein
MQLFNTISSAEVLNGTFELKDEIDIFLSDSCDSDDENLLQKLAYLVDILEKVSNLNKSMPGPRVNTLAQNGKVNSFMKKRNIFDIFPPFKNIAPPVKRKLKKFSSPTRALCRKFSLYFKDVDVSTF